MRGSHDWGTDELGRVNHDRVSEINKALQRAGLTTWFDDEQLFGDVNKQMADGIDNSKMIICFVTKNYNDKVAPRPAPRRGPPLTLSLSLSGRQPPPPRVSAILSVRRVHQVAGKGPKGDDDNCKYEFDYALLRKGVPNMITVVMEPCMKDKASPPARPASTQPLQPIRPPRPPPPSHHISSSAPQRQANWSGSLGGKLQGKLWCDATQDEPAAMAHAVEQIKKQLTESMSEERRRDAELFEKERAEAISQRARARLSHGPSGDNLSQAPSRRSSSDLNQASSRRSERRESSSQLAPIRKATFAAMAFNKPASQRSVAPENDALPTTPQLTPQALPAISRPSALYACSPDAPSPQ